jgi:hypothetical protein
MGEWRYSSTILDLGTKWRWVVSFTPRTLYVRGNSSRFPLARRLGGPQILSGCCGVQKNPLLRRKSNPGRPAHSLPLYRLSYPESCIFVSHLALHCYHYSSIKRNGCCARQNYTEQWSAPNLNKRSWGIAETVSCQQHSQYTLYNIPLALATSLILKLSIFRTTNNLVTGNYKLILNELLQTVKLSVHKRHKL